MSKESPKDYETLRLGRPSRLLLSRGGGGAVPTWVSVGRTTLHCDRDPALRKEEVKDEPKNGPGTVTGHLLPRNRDRLKLVSHFVRRVDSEVLRK